MNKFILSFAWISGFLAVAIGAYGAHILKTDADPEVYNRFLTGSRYHFYHTLALIGSLIVFREKKGLIAGSLFLAGIILFSGSIYLATIGGMSGITKITPAGGMLLMAGWIFSGVAALKINE